MIGIFWFLQYLVDTFFKKKEGGNYSLTTGWFWHTGKSYSVLNAANQFETFNTGRLLAYHRLDVSAIYHFREKKTYPEKYAECIWKVFFLLLFENVST